MTERRVLHVAAESVPLMKTGGLGDVVGALPAALRTLGHDVRILIPGYGAAVERARKAGELRTVAQWNKARLLEVRLPGGCPLWLYETPEFLARGDQPYDQADGTPWPDNAERFDEFARVATAIAINRLGLAWFADVVHVHDWHTGLVPVHMQVSRIPATTVFTIHNLAYQGLFPLATRARLGLPSWLEHWQALEFDQRLSFIKGGLIFADRITTVSETYAREITTPAFGEGLDELLSHRGSALRGIVNGIDTDQWDPATDPALATHYDADDPSGKQEARASLLAETGLRARPRTPVIAYIGRLARQKGVDVLLDALQQIVRLPAVVVVLGEGDPVLRRALKQAARAHPDKICGCFGFDEALARRIYAGADMLVMPSRFEPCGLGQLNAMRYGAIPVVRRTGGLAETVIDTTPSTLDNGTATGFQFDAEQAADLVAVLRRARALFVKPTRWQRLVRNAMRRDSSWVRSARAYAELYEEATQARLAHLPGPIDRR